MEEATLNARRQEEQLATRPFKDQIRLSLIGFGGILVTGLSREGASSLVAKAIDCGVNYFDVAPSYGNGEAEEKLGLALSPYRKNVFLACKTMQRDAAGARDELERSLRRLKTDHFDLYQHHAVVQREEVDRIFSHGGAAEEFLRAREEGTIRYIGFSAHSEAAALAMLDRFPFDSILFPVNAACYAQGRFGPRVMQRARESGVARLALKAMAFSPWPDGEERMYARCWYKPIDDPDLADLALRFTLSQDITSALPPGDERLFRIALGVAARYSPLTPDELGRLRAGTKDVIPLFHS